MARLIASPALIRLTEPASPVSSGVNRFSVPPLYCQPPALSYAPRVWYTFRLPRWLAVMRSLARRLTLAKPSVRRAWSRPPAGWVYGP